jgi:hypothetical protein
MLTIKTWLEHGVSHALSMVVPSGLGCKSALLTIETYVGVRVIPCSQCGSTGGFGLYERAMPTIEILMECYEYVLCW